MKARKERASDATALILPYIHRDTVPLTCTHTTFNRIALYTVAKSLTASTKVSLFLSYAAAIQFPFGRGATSRAS